MEIYTQETQKMNLKSTVSFLKLIGKISWPATDMATGMHVANAT